MGRIAALLVVILALPQVLSVFQAYQLGLYYLYAAAAIGIGLCWGQVGILPLGQSMFLGLGAYASALLLVRYQAAPWLLALLPAIGFLIGLIAYGVGRLAFRRTGESGAYFSMITLALMLLAFQVASDWKDVTGGYNGITGIPGLFGMDDYSVSYYWAAGVLMTAVVVSAWLYVAPVGILWRAIAQNERRVALFGFDVNRMKAVAFGVASFFAALAGVVYAPQQGFVAPPIAGFELSASLVIWTAIGGRSQLIGPALGAILIGIVSSELRDRFVYWEIVVSALFIFVVLIVPKGLAGILARFAFFLPRPHALARTVAAPPRLFRSREASLKVANLSARAGAVEILNQLSLDFDRPAIFCMIGPNGAGKTSTFNAISGELKTTAGAIDLAGRAIVKLQPHEIARLGVSRKFQIPSVFPALSIADNLSIALWSGRARPLDLIRPSLRRWSTPMLDELQRRYPFLCDAERKASELAHGERQILELCMALLNEPEILLLDEPCAGLSPQETAAVTDVVKWASGLLRCAIVIIEHDMALVKALADVVFVLHNGAVLAKGSVKDVQENPAVRAVYVGSEK